MAADGVIEDDVQFAALLTSSRPSWVNQRALDGHEAEETRTFLPPQAVEPEPDDAAADSGSAAIEGEHARLVGIQSVDKAAVAFVGQPHSPYHELRLAADSTVRGASSTCIDCWEEKGLNWSWGPAGITRLPLCTIRCPARP